MQLIFQVSNTSNVPVEVVDIQESCVCTEAALDSFVIEAHSRQTVSLTTDVTHVAQRADRLSIPFETLLRPRMRDNSNTAWKVDGLVRLPIAIPGGQISVDKVNAGETGRSFAVQRHPLVSQVGVTVDDAELVCRLIARGESGAADQYELIRAAGAPLGPFSSMLQFAATPQDGTRIHPVHVRASGVWSADYAWSPVHVVLGSDRSGSSAELIVIRSQSGAPMEVDQVSSTSPMIEANVIPSDDESSTAVRVQLKVDPAENVSLNTQVLISVTNPDSLEQDAIRVPVIAYARATTDRATQAKR